MSFETKLTGANVLNENEFGVQNSLVFGLQKVHNHLSKIHPLADMEDKRQILEDQFTFQSLKSLQGQHAPFRLKHEYEFAGKIGRLSCLKSSNLMLNVLRGTDETIDIKDVLNNQREFCEYNVDPHNELYKIRP